MALSDTRIVKLRRGTYAVQEYRFMFRMNQWVTMKEFQTLEQAREWRNTEYGGDVVEVIE